MTDTKTEVTPESLNQIGGGTCTPQEVIDITTQLTDAYESLIEFTTYMIGRVSGDPPAQP